MNKKQIKQVLFTKIGGKHHRYIFFGLIAVMAAVSIASFVFATSVADSFADETKIGHGTSGVNINTTAHTVTLPACYVATPSWSFVITTTVRDIAGAYNATILKDIYCDASNCVLWTNGVAITNTVCIATDSHVYANILWSASDSSSGKAWANTANSSLAISGGDIGGTHTTNTAGNSGVAIGGYHWLERYYSSANGTAPYYPAMDICKTKGAGWRLPNILELDSIRDMAKGSAPYSLLPAIVSSYYWSSSEGSTTVAWLLGFNFGYIVSDTKTGSYYVRCVRGY